jgi:hypothetical protein
MAHAVRELLIVFRELRVHVLANLCAQQAARGREDGQLGQRLLRIW